MPNSHNNNSATRAQTTTAWLFGTFNPIHVGHIAMAHAALASSHCQHVTLVPSAIPPWKSHHPDLLPFNDRCQLIDLALQHEPNLSCITVEADWTDIDANKNRPTTTWAIVEHLHRDRSLTWPATLIMGQDSVKTLGQWVDAETLIAHIHILQVPRLSPENAPLPFQQSVTLPNGTHVPLSTTLLPMAPVTVSSRQIRQTIKTGLSTQWRHQVHPDVANAILTKAYWC